MFSGLTFLFFVFLKLCGSATASQRRAYIWEFLLFLLILYNAVSESVHEFLFACVSVYILVSYDINGMLVCVIILFLYFEVYSMFYVIMYNGVICCSTFFYIFQITQCAFAL